MPAAANPLFLKWVKAFHAEKDYKKRGGPPRATGYENAIRSIESCTTKHDHTKDLKELAGVGPTCISRLVEKLEAHCEKNGIPMPEPKVKPRAPRKKAAAKKDEDEKKPAPKKRAPAKKRKRPDSDDEEEKYSDEDAEIEALKRELRPESARSSKRPRIPKYIGEDFSDSEITYR